MKTKNIIIIIALILVGIFAGFFLFSPNSDSQIESSKWDSMTYEPKYDRLEKIMVNEKQTIINLKEEGNIGKITLLSPLNKKVFYGKDREVFRFKIEKNESINIKNVLSRMDVFNIKSGKNINRTIRYEYIERIERINKTKYDTVCTYSQSKNDSEIPDCETIENGTYIKEKPIWREINLKTKTMPKKDIIIRGVTDVKKGDNVEWIPTFFSTDSEEGVRITEWATWTDNFNDGLVVYYTLNELSGNTTDIYRGIYNGSKFNDVTQGEDGIIREAYDFGGNNSGVNINNLYVNNISKNDQFTVSMWVNVSDNTKIMYGGFSNINDNAEGEFSLGVRNGNGVAIVRGGTQGYVQAGTINNNEWHHVVLAWGEGDMELFVDGSGVGSDTITGFDSDDNDYFTIGHYQRDDANDFVGLIDEIGVWNRTLNDTEISQLYNGGSGITYPNLNPLNVTLNFPANQTNFSVNTVLFNCSSFSDDKNYNLSLFIDDTSRFVQSNITANQSNISLQYNYTGLSFGIHNWTCKGSDSVGDVTGEFRIFNVTARAPEISLLSPEDNFVTPNNDLTIRCNASDDVSLLKMELYVDNVLNYTETNTTANQTNITLEYNGSYLEGNHDWYCYALDNINLFSNSSIRSFDIDITDPYFTFNEPKNIGFINLGDNFTLNYSVTDNNLDSCWYIYNDISNVSSIWNNGIYNDSGTGSPLSYPNIVLQNPIKQGDKITYYRDIGNVSITSPTNCSVNTIFVNDTDTGLDFNYTLWCNNNILGSFTRSEVVANSSQYTIKELDITRYNSCTSETDIITSLNISDNNYITLFTNDSAGNINSTIESWDVSILQKEISYLNSTKAGAVENFEVNITYNTNFTGIAVILNYNNTNYSMSTLDSGKNRIYSYDLIIPSTETTINNTFYIIYRLSNSSGTFQETSDSYNQSVDPFLIDNCSSNSNILLNMTMFDEDTLERINGTIELTIRVFSYGTNLPVNSYNNSFNHILSAPSQVCIENLSQNYTMDYEIRYTGSYENRSYFVEYKNIQNATIRNSLLPYNTFLYGLNNTRGEAFNIIVAGNVLSATGNSGLLIDSQRQYLSLNEFKSIESSLTSAEGIAVTHLVENEEVYNFLVSYDGEILGTFNNYKVKCANPTLGQCSITLNLASATGSSTDFENYGNITQSFIYNNQTKTLFQTYSVTNGNTKEVRSLVLKLDNYGNTTICNTTSVGTSGTLICVLPEIYQNTSFIVQTFVDGEYIGSKIFSDGDVVDWYGADIFILLLGFSAFVLLFVGHPITIVIGAIVGMVFPIVLISVAGLNFATLIGGVLYYIAGGIIVLLVMRRNQ